MPNERLYLIRPLKQAYRHVQLVRSEHEPKIDKGGRKVTGCLFLKCFCLDELKRITGVALRPGEVREVKSIAITFAGPGKRAVEIK